MNCTRCIHVQPAEALWRLKAPPFERATWRPEPSGGENTIYFLFVLARPSDSHREAALLEPKQLDGVDGPARTEDTGEVKVKAAAVYTN